MSTAYALRDPAPAFHVLYTPKANPPTAIASVAKPLAVKFQSTPASSQIGASL